MQGNCCRTIWLAGVLALGVPPSVDAQQADRADLEMPQVLAEGWELELVAREPEIVTPVAMTFDRQERLLVVESHTHFRPEGYDGPPADRIRALEDSDGDGRLDRWSTFHEGTTATMGLATATDGSIYAAGRGDLWRLEDTDGDGVADQAEIVVHLETEAEYPHNGLGGICFAGPDLLYLGIGENRGLPYTLVGPHGGRLEHGAGHGGSVYSLRLGAAAHDELRRVATGFWNPFAICHAPNGELFVLDNDPDASPPCRLIHVVRGGDYGFKYQYGRNGLHPLQAWDGQLPGTLPMVCGTGEAPSEIVAYRNALWVTSWGDHSIERYHLDPRASSFGAEKEVVVQGGTDFRPVGMAVAPDGSIYFSDWVKRSYELHGHGRIWRLCPTTDAPPQRWPAVTTIDGNIDGPQDVDGSQDLEQLRDDPFLATRWAYRQSQRQGPPGDAPLADGMMGLWQLQARRLANPLPPARLVAEALEHDMAGVRLYMLRWIADQHLTEYREQIEQLLDGEIPDQRYYLAVLAAVDWLSHPPAMTSSELADGLLARELRNDRRSADRQALALRLISPDHEQLTIDVLRQYLASDHTALRRQAAQTLALQSDGERFALLAAVAADQHEEASIRADATAGLAAAAAEHADLLKQLTENGPPAVQHEARRAWRAIDPGRLADEHKPSAENLDAWFEILEVPGNAEAGRRLFYSSVGARCGICHEFDGRGGTIGPELSTIGAFRTRRQLVQSILQPSAEMAPRFVPWILQTEDGKVRTGLKAPQGGDNGWETYYDAEGQATILPSEQIEERMPADVSIMPSGLEQVITIEEFRDLLAFLTRAEDDRPSP